MAEPFLFTQLPHADRLRAHAIVLRQQSTDAMPVSVSPSPWLASLRSRGADAAGHAPALPGPRGLTSGGARHGWFTPP